MLSRIMSALCIGIESYLIDIEVDISGGLPTITIVGLPDQAVKESKDRIKAAINNSFLPYPYRKKIVINLAPADIKKEGPIFDLPIALGMLASHGHIHTQTLKKFCIVGELALDGSLREIKGALPIALGLKDSGLSFIVPQANAREAALQSDIPIYAVSSLKQAADFLNGKHHLDPITVPRTFFDDTHHNYQHDFCDVQGQLYAKRAIEIAVSGGHNLLMIGPPGAGKTMLANRIPSIFPALSYQEALELTRIYSATGTLNLQERFITLRPFRAPHHTISSIALAGGGSIPKPGEVSLAHNGVLFLDELPEFNRSVLEVLRSPLEDGTVTIARSKGVLTFPSQFMLVCAMNPCPCGYYGDLKKQCHCASTRVDRYMSKISGPLLDRIDIHLEIRRPSFDAMKTEAQESSATIRDRVNAVRKLQQKRFRETPSLHCNAHMGSRDITRFCHLAPEANRMLTDAMHELNLSMRAYHKIIKIARTIRDMKTITDHSASDIEEMIHVPLQQEDIAEALHYRSLDRKWWA